MRNGLRGLGRFAWVVFLSCVVSAAACGDSDDGNGENHEDEIASWKCYVDTVDAPDYCTCYGLEAGHTLEIVGETLVDDCSGRPACWTFYADDVDAPACGCGLSGDEPPMSEPASECPPAG
jgi:hypothetical protein